MTEDLGQEIDEMTDDLGQEVVEIPEVVEMADVDEIVDVVEIRQQLCLLERQMEHTRINLETLRYIVYQQEMIIQQLRCQLTSVRP